MERAALVRLQRALRKRRGGLRSAEELLLAGIEIAGEQLNLDPTAEYTLDSFREALLAAFAPAEGLAEETLARLGKERVPVRDMAERVLREGKLQAVSFCYGELCRSVEDKAVTARLWRLCALAPEALLTAACVFLLRGKGE